MEQTAVFALVFGIFLLLLPRSAVAKLVGLITTATSIIILIYMQNAAIDAAIDVTEKLDLIAVQDTFCPAEFNRTNYCIEFGVNEHELTGQAFLSQPVSEYAAIRFETKDKLLNCKLTKDTQCNFAEVKSAKDLKITLTDKFGTTMITANKLRGKIKETSLLLRGLKWLKKIPIKLV